MDYRNRENLKAVMKSLLEIYTRKEIEAAMDDIPSPYNSIEEPIPQLKHETQ